MLGSTNVVIGHLGAGKCFIGGVIWLVIGHVVWVIFVVSGQLLVVGG
jgi:hypothetical protein